MNEKYYDITANISDKLVTFPGDPKYENEPVSTLEEGNHFHLSKIHLGNHTGTHIDFPAHVIKGGKTSSDFSIEDLIGYGVILEVPEHEASITKSFIQSNPIVANDFVLFKTSNSNISKTSAFTEKYVYIEPDAAEELVKKGVRVVGSDYISVDKYEAEDLPVHHVLLSKDVLIVEGLDLNNVPAGRYKIYIMPIKIDGMDGLPARVIVKMETAVESVNKLHRKNEIMKMTHDLRTPASGIYSMSRLIYKKMEDPELKKLQLLVVQSSEKLMKLLEDALD